MIPIDLDIDMLRCFKEVAETGSFTRAGHNIGLTQAGVSTKIRRLEERLNAKIFNRTSKTFSLTPDGELLLDYAGRILAVHDEAVSRFTNPKVSGLLRVGLIDYFIPELLPNLLGQFRKQYPNVHLEVQIALGTALIPLFEKGELDLVVAGKDDYQGNSRILTQEPLIWVIGKDADAPLQDSVDLVLFPSPCNFRKIAIESLQKVNRNWEIVFTGTSFTGIQTAVQSGMGLSVLPEGALCEGLLKAPDHMELPELPIFSMALFTEEQKKNDTRDVFIRYLDAEIKKRSFLTS